MKIANEDPIPPLHYCYYPPNLRAHIRHKLLLACIVILLFLLACATKFHPQKKKDVFLPPPFFFSRDMGSLCLLFKLFIPLMYSTPWLPQSKCFNLVSSLMFLNLEKVFFAIRNLEILLCGPVEGLAKANN